MADTLEDQWVAREPTMLDEIADWSGVYRHEFDLSYDDVKAVSLGSGLGDLGLVGVLRQRAQDIVDGANQANTDQVALNDAAEALTPEERLLREQAQTSRPPVHAF